MKNSPLAAKHEALGAKMADFGGWLMPIEYPGGGVLAEHDAVRNRVGIFDVSRLGRISVTGPGAKDYINSILTNDLDLISDGEAQYNLLCNEAGGVIDDIIAYRNSVDDIFLVPNAANCAKVFEVLTMLVLQLVVDLIDLLNRFKRIFSLHVGSGLHHDVSNLNFSL